MDFFPSSSPLCSHSFSFLSSLPLACIAAAALAISSGDTAQHKRGGGCGGGGRESFGEESRLAWGIKKPFHQTDRGGGRVRRERGWKVPSVGTMQSSVQ